MPRFKNLNGLSKNKGSNKLFIKGREGDNCRTHLDKYKV